MLFLYKTSLSLHLNDLPKEGLSIMTPTFSISEPALFPVIKKIVLFDTDMAGQTSIPQRVTEHYEISFFISGSGHFCIDGTPHEIKKGAVRFSHPNETIHGVPPYCCCTIFFDLFDPSNIEYEWGGNTSMVPAPDPSWGGSGTGYHYTNDILDAFPCFFYTAGNKKNFFLEALELFYQGGTGSTFRLNALLMGILSEYYYVIKWQKGRSLAVKQSVEYIHEHFTENITLETLSALTNYSSLHIRRKFVSEIGMSPSEFLLSVRLTKAKKLLAETSNNIIDIAAMCGFSSEAYFYTTFKSSFGITPGKYRAMMQLS